MKKIVLVLVLGLFVSSNTYADQKNVLKCGGKYVGYNDNFLYLNWQEDEHQFKDKVLIKEKTDTSLIASLPRSDKIELNVQKKYISYSFFGKEKLVLLCKKFELNKL
jgi:hypothetical protein